MPPTKEVQIPHYEGQVIDFEGITIHPNKTYWRFNTEGEEVVLPVYSIWNYSLHKEIAAQIAEGKAAAIYMWGTYGIGKLLRSPEWEEPEQESEETSDSQKPYTQEAESLYEDFKIGRPLHDKYSSILYPDDQVDSWDIDRLHSSLSYLQWAKNRIKLTEAGPVHIIPPFRRSSPHFDPSLITENDWTIANYYMPHPAFNHLVLEVRRAVKNSIFGGGSLNYHGETPAFDTPSLYKMISEKPKWKKIGLVIVCEITESFHIDRGQLQIRLAQKGSDGVSEIVRDGALMAQTWSEYTGIPIKPAPEGVKQASSRLPYKSDTNLIIDWRVQKSKELMAKFHNQAA